MALGVDDISIFFQDGTLCTVEATGQKAYVNFDFPEEIENFGGLSKPGVSQGRPRIQYATSSLALSNGTIVVVEGTRYKAMAPHKIDDGLVSVADLAKA